GKTLKASLLAALVSATNPGFAHTVWLDPVAEKTGEYQLLVGGHAGKLEPLERTKLKSIDTIDASGVPAGWSWLDSSGGARIQVAANTVMVAIHYDNGIWTRDAMGRSVNTPMNDVPGAEAGTLAVKYHKTVVSWENIVSKPLGQPFEVIPLDSSQPVAGKPLKVQVLLDGKPLSGASVRHVEDDNTSLTDAQGLAEFVPTAGVNKLWAGHRQAVSSPTHTELSYEYLLGFAALPQS
ncbi:MAG: DUF4198 domain-containing protein, partial [Parahaliea sp.]